MVQYPISSLLCLILDVPNSGRGEKTDKDPKGYPPKINNGERQMFDEFLRGHVKTLEKSKPVVLTGDLNVSHTEIGNLILVIITLRSQTKLLTFKANAF